MYFRDFYYFYYKKGNYKRVLRINSLELGLRLGLG